MTTTARGLPVTAQAQLLAEHADELRAAARDHQGTGHILVFGSVARGTALPDSDIDLLVEFLPEASLFDQLELERRLEQILGTSVDVMSLKASGRAANHARAQAVEIP